MSDDSRTGETDSFDAPWMEGVDPGDAGASVRWSPVFTVWTLLLVVFVADIVTPGGLPGVE